MAIPASSDGQEVLRRGAIVTQSNTGWTSFKFDGTSPSTHTASYVVPTNHIITILSIIVCNQTANAETFNLNDNAGYLLDNQPLAGRATFIWAERWNLKGGEKLQILSPRAGSDLDVLYSYLDQDWS